MRVQRVLVLLTMVAGLTCDRDEGVTPLRTVSAPLTAPSETTSDDARAADARFREWLSAWLPASKHGRGALERDGVRLATEREVLLRRVMLDDAALALQLAITPMQRATLSPAIANHVERWHDGLGTLHVIAGVNEGGPPPPTERFVGFDDSTKLLRAGVSGRRANDKTQERLRLHGLELDGVIALTDRPMRQLLPGELRAGALRDAAPCPTSKRVSVTELQFDTGDGVMGFCVPEHAAAYEARLVEEEVSAALTAASAWTTGPKTVLFIRVDFSDKVGDPVSVAAAQTLINTTVNTFYVASSFNKTTMSVTVTPTYRMAKTAAEYVAADNYTGLMSDARAAAAADGFPTANYTLDIIGHAGIFGGWTGRGYVGSKGTWINGAFDIRTTGHELGHNYGAWHANFWNAGDSIFGAGTNQEYANPFDIMGNSGTTSTHFNVWEKYVFDWVTAPEVKTVTTSGTSRIIALESAISSGLHGLKVPRPGDAQQRDYWLEFRQALTTNATSMNGAQLFFGYPFMGSAGSHLLDVTPDGDRSRSAIVIGHTFSDPMSQVFITPIGKGGTTPESLDIVTNFGPYPGNHAPTLTLGASATTVASGTAVTFTATAADADGDTLAYGWDFDDGTYGPNAAIATKTLSGNRVFTARCTVSDMKGLTASAQVFVTVGTPTKFSLSGTVTVAGQPASGVRITDGTRTTFTIDDGTWRINEVPAGMYTVNAFALDTTFTRSFTVPMAVAANTAALDFTGTVVTGRSISGKVTATAGVPGVIVSDGTRTATTNASGNYTLTNVPNGRYTLTATLPGWAFGISGAKNPVEVYGGNLTGVNFLSTGQWVAGSLPATVTTAPVVSDGYRSVTATRSSASQPWNYFLSGMPNGTWNITATSPGVTLTPLGFSNPVTIAGMGRSNLNFAVAPGATYSVSGVVRSGTTPIPGVSVTDGTRTAVTDSFGKFVIVGVPSGSFTLTPTRAGYTFVPVSKAIVVTSANLTGQDFTTTVVNAPPTIVQAPSATPSTTTGPTSVLSVLAADDTGEGNLTYLWEFFGYMSASYSVNGTNAAKTTSAMFSSAGTYPFQVTVTDPGGLTAVATVTVTVTAVPTTLVVTPATASVAPSAIQNFSYQSKDQFNNFVFPGTVTWSVPPAAGSITTFGQLSASATPGGPFTVTAAAAVGLTATATVNIIGAGAPSIVAPASATPNPVVATTTHLAVLATDDAGEAGLTYTWAMTNGPAPVTYSVNASNAAKSTTATFSAAGDYDFNVNAVDGSGNAVTSTVHVTVQATSAAVRLSPSSASVQVEATQQFDVTVVDQFGADLALQPTIAYAIAPAAGVVDAAGLFTAASTPGGPYALTASSGGVSATAQVTVLPLPDIVAPVVSITSPDAGADVMGQTSIMANATDAVGVASVELFSDGVTLGAQTTPPFEWLIDVSVLGAGSHVLTAKAVDAAGNLGTSAPVTVNVVIDVAAPVVSITVPLEAARTGLTNIAVHAEATDDVAVTQVTLELDGAMGTSLTSAPYDFTLDVAAGDHVLVAVASDAAGKTTRSAPVHFTAVDPTVLDAGVEPDAGAPAGDAGAPFDAGSTVSDAGLEADAGTTSDDDAGVVEADGGAEPLPGDEPAKVTGGCSCGDASAGPLWLAVATCVLAFRARRKRVARDMSGEAGL